MDTPTTAAARFVAGLKIEDVPAEVQDKARGCLLYGLGIGLACIDGQLARTAFEAVHDLDGPGGARSATALASGVRLPLSAAAFANAVMLHGRCQEDTCGSAHLGVAIVPTLLALVESGLAPASRLLVACVAAYQVAGRIERSLGRHSTAKGFRASALYGTLAAAVAAAKLLDLSEDQVQAALANAAGFAGGTLQAIADGTDEWRYQMGAAVRRGLEAALLARAGSIGSPAALDGPLGFAHAFAGTALETPPFEEWILGSVAFKLYPVCNRNQTAALLASRIREQLDPEQIARVEIRINPNVLAGMLERGPFTRLGQTLMSTYFCCAAAIAFGAIELRTLGDFDNPEIARLVERMDIRTDASVPYPSAAAEVLALDGRRILLSENKRFEDYSFSRPQINALLQRLADEMRVPQSSMRSLDAFAYGAEMHNVHGVLHAFEAARASGRP